MMYADTASGRAEAAPGLAGTCPSCGHPCRPKCGKIVIWHWAHHARGDCDPWSEPMTEWHLGWQRAVPPERREVVMGPHRADIVTASGGVVEIQHSPIPVDMIGEREEFYGERMAWIFDATKADIDVQAIAPALANTPCGCSNELCTRIWPRPGTACPCRHEGCTGHMAERKWQYSPEVRFRWRHARRSITACRRPVLLDLGDGTVLRLGRFAPAADMTGVLYTRTSIEQWLRDGARWERITLRPTVSTGAGYAHPSWARFRAQEPEQPQPEQPQAELRQLLLAQEQEAQERREAAARLSARLDGRPIRPWEMDRAWLAGVCRIVPEVGPDACQTLQRVVLDKYRAGELALPDCIKVRAMIKARMEALKRDAAPPGAGD